MNEMTISELKRIFLGEYSLERVVLNHESVDNNDPIHMSGKVVFTQISNLEIEYREFGSYTLNGMSHDFYQTRYFRFDDNHLYILKSDKMDLHALPIRQLLAKQRASHSHLCRDDIYLVTMKLDFGSIKIDYDVSGPTKNYAIRTIISPTSR